MNMKKVIICLVLAMMSVAGYAQSVVGKWVTEGGDSQVEIYQSGDKLNGKTYKCSIWLDGNNLKVRGYIAMFYETQTWTKK